MPKKLIYPKEAKIASIKLQWTNFQVIAKMDQTNIGYIAYYQVQCKRKKIANYTDEELAIRRMFAEANYELQSLFKLKMAITEERKIIYNQYNKPAKFEISNIIASVGDTGKSIQGTKLK